MAGDRALADRIVAEAPLGWRRPGFERPLAGLLFYIVALLLLTGPFLFLTVVLVPAKVQPFPQVDGALGAVDELLLLGWSILDFGMGSAVVRACASLRATDRAQIPSHLRLLLRWELGVAIVISALGIVAALWVVPGTRYAPLRDALLLRSIAAPLLAVMAVSTVCEALQRYDRQLLLELLDKRLLTVVLPIPCVLVLRGLAWHDEATRALVGVAVGQALSLTITCGVGFRLLDRMGLPFRSLWTGPMPPDNVRRQLLRFGAGIMAGKSIFFLTSLVELSLVATWLPDFPSWLGLKALLLGRLLQPMWLLWPFCETAMPTVAEAWSAGMRMLVRSLVARYLAFGHLFVATLFALALGAGPPLVAALLPASWQPAVTLIPIAGLTGLLLPLTWVGDAIQRAAGESGRNALFLLGEQALRLTLLVVALPQLGLAGLFLATAIAAAAKTLAVFIDLRIRHFAFDLRWGPIALAPLGAAIAVGVCARGLVVIALPLGLGSVALVAAAVIAFPLAFFVAGAVGGFEPEVLGSLRAAAGMVPIAGVTGPWAKVIVRMAEAGASLGPRTRNSVITVEACRERAHLERGEIPQPNETH